MRKTSPRVPVRLLSDGDRAWLPLLLLLREQVAHELAHEWQVTCPMFDIRSLVVSDDDGWERHDVVHASQRQAFWAIHVYDAYVTRIKVMLFGEVT